MRHCWIAGFFGALMILSGGCRSTITVDGKKYSMVTDREMAEMLSAARFTLQNNLNNPKVITPDEFQSAKFTEPHCKVDYFGDMLGTARFTWDFPTRKTTVMIRGELNNPRNRLIAVSIVEKLPPVIDTTHSIPADAPIWQKK